MIILFSIIIITSIWVLGIKIATSPDMVLHKLGEWGQKKVDDGHRIYEAIIVCEYCMPSIHSIIGYAFAYGVGVIQCFTWNEVIRLIVMYPLVVMGSSLFNGIVWGLHKKMDASTKTDESKAIYYENVSQLSFFDLKDRKAKYNIKKKAAR